MPELPEVEVIRQGLMPHLNGRTICEIRCSGKPLRSPVPCSEMRVELCGHIISTVHRRAKYLIVRMDNGAALIIHLGMTGNMGIFAKGSTTQKHDHVCWGLDNGTELRFNDTRRFGAVRLLEAATSKTLEKQFFAAIGPEPFSRSCSARYLANRAAGRKTAIKKFIMNSHVIAGIGNIYANESLFRSKIHPERAAASLSDKEWQRLLGIIRKTLKDAIACGGSTISDFVDASGKGGYFQINFQVYGKDGETCRICWKVIIKKYIDGRASFICPGCQEQP